MVTDAIPDEIMREATLVAVDMEIHAALSTTTRAKAEVIAKALMARKRDAQMTDALLTAEARVRELEQKLERARVALAETTEWLDDASHPYIPGTASAEGWNAEREARLNRARTTLAEIGQRS